MKRKKVKPFLLIMVIIGLLVTIACGIFADYLFGDESIFVKIVEENELNSTIDSILLFIPRILNAIKVATISTIFMLIVKLVLAKTLNKNNHQKTINKMLWSLAKYFSAIIIFLVVLNVLGVDTTALIAGAGVLTLVVGLGAQNLIADIIAGISFVFEGQFEIGETVTIDGFRGDIEEIGIRTTKIVDWQGHVMTISNSKIVKVLNESKNNTYATCYVDVDYDTDIKELEEIIAKNLEEVNKAIPELVSPIEYKGISELKDSGVQLFFTAECTTSNLYPVMRKMNKEIKLMLDKNYCKLILVDNNELIGFISIFPNDCDEEQELSPWYATMYVKEKYRGNGYSRILNDAIIREASNRGIEKLYLKTCLENYYEKFGAQFIKLLSSGERLYFIKTK